jgi:hypothetical protein
VKLPGYLDPSFVPPAPSIYAQIESGVLKGRGTVAFLVDTGASVTTIMDRDRDRLGIDWNRLDKTKRPLSGIGGTVDTRIIRDGILLFKTDTGGTVRERLQVHVAKHDSARMDRHGRERVLQLPWLLGRDMIERYGLIYDKSKSTVYLER